MQSQYHNSDNADNVIFVVWSLWSIILIANTYDIWEENVTTRREFQTKHVRSLEFRDIREGATSRRLGCTLCQESTTWQRMFIFDQMGDPPIAMVR